jgi:hypothetical protein
MESSEPGPSNQDVDAQLQPAAPVSDVRVARTLTNPRGYSPLDVTRVLSYSSRRIQWHLKHEPMTPEIRRSFLEAVQDRQTLRNIFGETGDSSASEDEGGGQEENRVPPQVNPDPASLKLRAGLSPFHTDINTSPDPKLDDDGKPDIDYPLCNDLYKTLKISHINHLQYNYSISSFINWFNHLEDIFIADPNRYGSGS